MSKLPSATDSAYVIGAEVEKLLLLAWKVAITTESLKHLLFVTVNLSARLAPSVVVTVVITPQREFIVTPVESEVV
jgi:hypothetical protein